ncbi:uncharacterized protein MONOS_7758 [Monocercomonoides exilis]|uniref:uncharacterized protein n=1 Tax=Monocercomonoides exilis TaxID=2049356 RepID=UPI00355A474C|nr:hypothetical protein MONOS_7758 [Monocercomonoides exilis]|eukprot:MONOS_7758.1-p1 / transcript=MONOS_7758.1 / gene=MONOS_7758 / organism=Monocercomonoides_exilis_PA203 / gene_product=unspecified product / transcript_product=unspecified product / location=Mono_scaffold00273:66809-67423(+) / protein_length=205 / sequence_SO=supercontig / SO=protein_coding / is_pseudo=false
MIISQPLFIESSSRSTTCVLSNVRLSNVRRVGGDGVLASKTVGADEGFEIWNATLEDCECTEGNGCRIKVDFASTTSKLRVGSSSTMSGTEARFSACGCGGYGGGLMKNLIENASDFKILVVNFAYCSSEKGGNFIFVNSNDLSQVINGTTLAFSVDINDEMSCSGFERGTTGEGFVIPLVLYSKNLSFPVFINGTEGADFSAC